MTRTYESPLIAVATPVELERLVDYAVRHAATMTADMVQGKPERAGALVGFYIGLCEPLGLDPVLCVAQSWHETDLWSSWWFQAPRRNPAGIGVFGGTPQDHPGAGQWQQRADGKWAKGHAYPSWATAAMSHVHGLALWAGCSGSAIRDLAVKAKKARIAPYTPPKNAWGSARTPLELGSAYNPRKTGWAVPGHLAKRPDGTNVTPAQAFAEGKTYGHGIARHARAAIGVASPIG